MCALVAPDGSLQRRLYALGPRQGDSTLLASPPGECLDESHLPREERLRRERQRERGLGSTR